MARNASTRWYAAIAALVVAILIAWLAGGVLTLTPGERVVVRVAFIALGLIAAAALLWFLRPADGPELPAAAAAGDEALTAIAAARARMPRGAFDAHPMVLVVGPAASCKTSVIVHAGMDPELLAGDDVRGTDAPPSTKAANLWLASDAVFVEPGGDVFADAARWRTFLRRLGSPRFAAAFGRGSPAPRAVVLCVSCDLFYAGDGGAQLDALAQLARERLADAARELGAAVPVYVVFTKADRVALFEPWVTPLTNEEAREPVGAALPFDSAAAASGKAARAVATGTYAERMQPRIAAAFDGIVGALASRRLDFLGRDSRAERRLEAYELPRSIGKLMPAASRFLIEICRPTQLGDSPQLRGFYFVGARPVLVSDATSSAAPAAAAGTPRHHDVDATSVFSAVAAAPRAAAVTPRAGSVRRVPQWVFLDRIFPDVVLADESAAAAGRGGTRVAVVRRGLLGAGIAAMLVVATATLISALGNRALLQRTSSAASAVATLPTIAAPAGTIAFPSPDALTRLDALRASLDTLRSYQTAGAPLHLRWGLWQGDAALAAGTRVWLGAFHDMLQAPAWGAVVDSLRALPDAPRPDDDYGRDYAMLQAYLVMTAEPGRSTPSLLAPPLLSAWSRGQTLDADVAALARRQFEFYATLLPVSNPWPESADAAVVQHARAFLSRFTGADQIYQNMLTAASKAAPPASVNAAGSPAPGIVASPAEMPGAFTAAGWKFMQGAFGDVDRYFRGEAWVVGDAATTTVQDRERTVADLRARYAREYVQRWRAFVAAMRVARPSTTRDAADKLGALGGAESPLLANLALVARNTAVDSTIAAAFQPVQIVTPPGTPGKNIGDSNQQYADALIALQGSIEQVANMPPATDSSSAGALAQAGVQALSQVTQAKVAARQLSQKFAIDTAAAPVGSVVAALLVAPIEGAEAMLRRVAATRAPARRAVASGAAGGGASAAARGAPAMSSEEIAKLTAILNERGRALCDAITPMLAKFPFSPDATNDATFSEVAAMLAPNTGALWAFQQERLTGLLEKQGPEWVAKADAPIALSAPFVSFFNRAAKVSQALYGGGSELHVAMTVHAATTDQMPLVTLMHGTQAARFDKGAAPAQLVWPPASGREARLIAKVSGRFRSTDHVLGRATGDWAMFRLVAQAPKAEASGGSLHTEWPIKDESVAPLSLDFTFPSGSPVLRRGWLGGMVCTPRVTR
jgi:type VI secretion system protein ImpL